MKKPEGRKSSDAVPLKAMKILLKSLAYRNSENLGSDPELDPELFWKSSRIRIQNSEENRIQVQKNSFEFTSLAQGLGLEIARCWYYDKLIEYSFRKLTVCSCL
jgi:hypothetical protein